VFSADTSRPFLRSLGIVEKSGVPHAENRPEKSAPQDYRFECQRVGSRSLGRDVMRRSGLASLLAVLASAVALQTLSDAQSPSPDAQHVNHAAAPSQQPAVAATQPVVVANLKGINTTTWSELGRTVTVAQQGLRDWSKTNGNDVRSLHLYLAGHVLPGQPTLISLSEEYVNFHSAFLNNGFPHHPQYFVLTPS